MYIKKGIVLLGVVFFILLLAPVLFNFINIFETSAATPEDIKNHIRSQVDDQIIYIPNHGNDSLGRYLWGLAGCEAGWSETTDSANGLYFGLYQYTTGTWQSVHNMMGIAVPDIHNGLAQIDASIYIIKNPLKTGGFNNWPGCTD